MNNLIDNEVFYAFKELIDSQLEDSFYSTDKYLPDSILYEQKIKITQYHCQAPVYIGKSLNVNGSQQDKSFCSFSGNNEIKEAPLVVIINGENSPIEKQNSTQN